MTYFDNPHLGIYFKYPDDWLLLEDNKRKFDADILLQKDSLYFGVLLFKDYFDKNMLNYLTMLTRTNFVHSSDILLKDIHQNKYHLGGNPNVTVITVFLDKKGNTVYEKTIVVNKGKGYMLVFEDISDNYESGYTQNQINVIYNTFRFIN